MDKNQKMIEYLSTCPVIADSPLYFNFISAMTGDDKQFVTITNDKTMNRPFIDGSVQKRYSVTIIDYRSVSYQALTNDPSKNENVEELLDVQGIIDWIDTQNEARTFPDFGTDCQIDAIRSTTENPNLNGVDTSSKPALAKYSITIQVDYIDTSKRPW